MISCSSSRKAASTSFGSSCLPGWTWTNQTLSMLQSTSRSRTVPVGLSTPTTLYGRSPCSSPPSAIPWLPMNSPPTASPMRARRLRAHDRFHRLPPQPPGRRLAAVVRDVVVRRADDPEAAEAVAERERDRLLHRPVLRELLRGGERDVAGGRVEMEHGGQDELHRTALRAGHQVDAARVATHPLLDLMRGEQDERDRPDPEREQHEVERRVERLRPEVGNAEAREVHWITPALKRARGSPLGRLGGLTAPPGWRSARVRADRGWRRRASRCTPPPATRAARSSARNARRRGSTSARRRG